MYNINTYSPITVVMTLWLKDQNLLNLLDTQLSINYYYVIIIYTTFNNFLGFA